MTKAFFLILPVFYLTSCNTEQASTYNTKTDTSNLIEEQKMSNNAKTDIGQNLEAVSNSADSLIRRLKGLWTDGTTEGATLDIKDKTIHYVDEGGYYEYSVNRDNISIKFTDYTYKAKLSFRSDTLVMNSYEYGETKFWRFKN
jgi:hypothetical protein